MPSWPAPHPRWINPQDSTCGSSQASACSAAGSPPRFPCAKVVRSAAPYDVPFALALLKVPTGALTAVTGILLLGGGFVPGFSELDTQRQILAYAPGFRSCEALKALA